MVCSDCLASRLTKAVDVADRDLVAASELGLELVPLVHSLVVIGQLLLVLLHMLRQDNMLCELEDLSQSGRRLGSGRGKRLTLELVHVFLLERRRDGQPCRGAGSSEQRHR